MTDDDFQYRSAVTAPRIEQDNPSIQDEANFDTLVEVKNILNEAVESLGKDFQSFNLMGANTEDEAVKKLVYEINGRQLAYSLLKPVLEMVKTTIDQVDNKYRRY